MKEVRKIKGLKSQLKIIEGDAEALKVEVANKQREYSIKKRQIQALRDEIERFEKNQEIKVSEHAIVRYFERVKGYDILEIENEILNEDVLKLIKKLGGNGSYPNKNFSVLIRDFTVTTITT